MLLIILTFYINKDNTVHYKEHCVSHQECGYLQVCCKSKGNPECRFAFDCATHGKFDSISQYEAIFVNQVIVLWYQG